MPWVEQQCGDFSLMLRALLVVLSHQPQRDAGGEHPSADDKRLMMSGPPAFFSLLLGSFSTAVGEGAGDAFGFYCHTAFIWDLLSAAAASICDCYMAASAPSLFSAWLCLSWSPSYPAEKGVR